MNVLIVDDEVEILELIELYLTSENYTIIKASDGIEALKAIEKHEITLAVVDIMMPNMNGLNLIKNIRKTLNIPIIVISARDEFSDKILGLEVGADDYITKPFNPLELVARIKAQLRRYSELKGDNSDNRPEVITLGSLTIDPGRCMVLKEGETVELTLKEYKILECLSRDPGRVYTKHQVHDYVWGEGCYVDDNVLRIHISNLRDKIEESSKNPVYIKTVRGLGYKAGTP